MYRSTCYDYMYMYTLQVQMTSCLTHTILFNAPISLFVSEFYPNARHYIQQYNTPYSQVYSY